MGVSCEETDNYIYNNPHKGNKKDSYTSTEIDSTEKVESRNFDFSMNGECWSDGTVCIRDRIAFGLTQFDTDLSERFKATQTACGVLSMLQDFRAEYLPDIAVGTVNRLFYKSDLSLHTVVHLLNTACKVHFVSEGYQGTIRTTPERFFVGILCKWRKPTLDQLLDSLDYMASDNAERYDTTISERHTIRKQEQQHTEKRKAERHIRQTVLDTAISKRQFKDIIYRLRGEYGHQAYDTWLRHLIPTENGLTAPKWYAEWIQKTYVSHIKKLMYVKGV